MSITVMDLRKETIKTATNFCRVHARLLASVDTIGFQTTEKYSGLDITNVKYNMYTHSRDEMGEVYAVN
jgi:hypothetical protein